jgi:hypothetical protein
LCFVCASGRARSHVAAEYCRRSDRKSRDQNGHCSDDAIVTPATVLTRQFHDQLFDCRIDSWATGQSAFLRAVEFLSDELPIPDQDRIRFGDAGDFQEGFPPQTLGNPSQGRPLGIGQLQSPFDLRFEDVILSRQVLVPQEQLLVDGTRHISQQLKPILLVRHD